MVNKVISDNKLELLKEAEAIHKKLQYLAQFSIIDTYYSQPGLMLSDYPQHGIFYRAGATHRQRLFLCANRVGKTTGFGIELVYHLTGNYPDDWVGKRYNKPQHWWVCGKTKEKVKEILQELLLGHAPQSNFGSGLIPRASLDLGSIVDATKVATPVSAFKVRFEDATTRSARAAGSNVFENGTTVPPKFSTVEFKSYDQGRDAFEGTERCIWLDEEPPQPVYEECLLRTMTGDCMLVMTFTPMDGLTKMIEEFLGGHAFADGECGSGKYLVMATWDDAPHLDEKAKAELWASIPEHQRDARTKGIPRLGSGAVYPVKKELLFIEPFKIPDHWLRVGIIDFGWEDPTAIAWIAINPDTNDAVQYAENYNRQKPYDFHVSLIKNMWDIAKFDIPMLCDPSGGGRSIADGTKVRELYRKSGIILHGADNSLEGGIQTTLDQMNRGKLKIFETCVETMREWRAYRRDEGKLKGDDHLMDCIRYYCNSGLPIAKSRDMVKNSITKRKWVPSPGFGHGPRTNEDWYYGG